jgi:5-(carboxyamino)imidazole ribonucleotide synthase
MIGVLGGGQLGRMLGLAGLRLGRRFCFLDPAPDAPAAAVGKHIVAPFDDRAALDELASLCDVVTFEFENVPAASARRLDPDVPVYPPPQALEAAQRRPEEKRWFEKLGIPTASFASATNSKELRNGLENVGLPAMVKAAVGGYDGKGQRIVRDAIAAGDVWATIGAEEVLIERLVEFERELSIIAVRSGRGKTAFYPLVENHHRDGILRMSVSPAADLSPELQAEAGEIAYALLEALDYVGVLAVELFQTSSGLLANEMAPRVHNSGHFSIDASCSSQFENHIRAISNLPLGSTEPVGRATMFNLISELPDIEALLRVEGLRVHLYDKQPRPGRKLGHVTLVDADDRSVDHVRRLLSEPMS